MELRKPGSPASLRLAFVQKPASPSDLAQAPRNQAATVPSTRTTAGLFAFWGRTVRHGPYRGCGPPARPHAQRRFGAAATLVGHESLGPLDTPRSAAQESGCHCAEDWGDRWFVRVLGEDRETRSLRTNMKLKRLTGERPSTVLAWHRVAEGNCVAVRRGGEQPKANLSSQSSQTRRLNPIRLVGVASLRAKGEALALSLPEAITKHDRKIVRDSEGGWDEKAEKADQLSVEILSGATESGKEVRALIVALKRVTTVEPRGVGR